MNSGENIKNALKVIQNAKNEDCESENGWKNAPVFVMEICLGEKESNNTPLLFLSKFEYFNINEWSEGCSPANHWAFYYPLRNEGYMDFQIKDDYKIVTPKNDKISKTYWGLKRAITKTISLFDITADNLKEKVFDEFDRLSNLDI